MKRPYIKILSPLALAAFLALTSGASAVRADSIVVQPVRVISVDGDAAKFRAINWVNDGTTGGIKELNIDRKVGKDVQVSFEGRMIPGDNDLGGILTLSKGTLGYMKLDYGTFRKWYTSTAGYYPYNTLAVNKRPEDLKMDIGHLTVETGLGAQDDPDLSFSFEHDTKLGSKDRLTWASLVDSSIYGASITKKTSPSYSTVDETTDTLTLKGKREVAGNVVLRGAQSYEFFDAHNFREEKQLATVASGNTPDSNLKIRRQIQDPQTKLFTTNVTASRWSLNDKTYVSAGYLYAQSRSSEMETIREYTGADVWTGAFGSSKNRDGWAKNKEDRNTWTAQIMSSLTDNFSVDAKAKAELIKRDSFSDYDIYNSALAVGGSDHAVSENKTVRTGQSVGLRYSGISKTSLYAESEMRQERNWLAEERIPRGVADALIDYENIANKPEFIQTVGARYVPVRWLNFTNEYKNKNSTAKYNTIHNSAVAVGPAFVPAESFMNKIHTVTNEVASKVTWKPLKRVENSFKYRFAGTDFHTQVVNQDWLKTHGYEKSLTYDLTVTPTDPLMFNLGLSMQLLKASTPASASSTLYLPPFTGNVYGGSFTTSYAPRDNVSVYNTLDYSRARNNNNNYRPTTGAFLYGSHAEWYDAIVGLRWSPKDDITIEPHYGYYGYRAYESIESGNYSAHVMMVDVKYKW